MKPKKKWIHRAAFVFFQIHFAIFPLCLGHLLSKSVSLEVEKAKITHYFAVKDIYHVSDLQSVHQQQHLQSLILLSVVFQAAFRALTRAIWLHSELFCIWQSHKPTPASKKVQVLV